MTTAQKIARLAKVTAAYRAARAKSRNTHSQAIADRADARADRLWDEMDSLGAEVWELADAGSPAARAYFNNK